MTDEEAINLVIEAAKHFYWHIGVPKQEPDDDIKGMIIGTEQYVDEMTRGHAVLATVEEDRKEDWADIEILREACRKSCLCKGANDCLLCVAIAATNKSHRYSY